MSGVNNASYNTRVIYVTVDIFVEEYSTMEDVAPFSFFRFCFSFVYATEGHSHSSDYRNMDRLRFFSLSLLTTLLMRREGEHWKFFLYCFKSLYLIRCIWCCYLPSFAGSCFGGRSDTCIAIVLSFFLDLFMDLSSLSMDVSSCWSFAPCCEYKRAVFKRNVR